MERRKRFKCFFWICIHRWLNFSSKIEKNKGDRDFKEKVYWKDSKEVLFNNEKKELSQTYWINLPIFKFCREEVRYNPAEKYQSLILQRRKNYFANVQRNANASGYYKEEPVTG